MAGENHHFEKKSLRKVMGTPADWQALGLKLLWWRI